jgi:hypothetical protein
MNNKQVLSEIDRSKELMKYTTTIKKKNTVEASIKDDQTIKEFKSVSLTDFLKG